MEEADGQALVDFPQDGPQSQAGLSARGRWGIHSQVWDIVDLRTEDLVDFVCPKHPQLTAARYVLKF